MKAYEIYTQWVNNVLNEELKEELIAIKDDPQEIENRFFKTIEFGTAGLRGILGAGTNYLNIYVIRRATQGLAAYMLEHKLNKVAIAYDSRHMSQEFAIETAEVLAHNGINCYITEELQPTPFLSFAVRELKCSMGVMITASHNPAQYNGYKVYGSDGCQITSKTAEQIVEKIGETSFFGIERIPFDQGMYRGLIKYCPNELIELFLKYGRQLRTSNKSLNNLKVVYTPLNGAGWKMVPLMLNQAKVNLFEVPLQAVPDKDFTTCPFPNPEIKEALSLGLQVCKENNVDLLLATDPDCDRVGVAVKHCRDYTILNGNEIGVLLLDYLLNRRAYLKTLPTNGVVLRSIVSSILADKIAQSYNVKMVKTLTGFKYIGEYIMKLEENNRIDDFIFGFEESCGYLAGTYVRDKEAVSTSLLIAEMASYYKKKGKTLVNRLEQIYKKFGRYRHHMCDFYFEGANGFIKMNEILNRIRTNPFTEIKSSKVTAFIDYNNPIENLPKTNMMEFTLEGGEQIIIRPSGTEPKIKVYITTAGNEEGSKSRLEEYDRFIEKLFLEK